MSNKIKGMLTSNSNEWETPQDLFDRLNRIFHFNLDVAANDENHKCEEYITKEQDGLTQNWGGVQRMVQSTLWQRDSQVGAKGSPDSGRR